MFSMGQLDSLLPGSQQAWQAAQEESRVYGWATSEPTRKTVLKNFAMAVAAMAKQGRISDGEGFVRVARQAVSLVRGLEEIPGGYKFDSLKASVMMDDLKRVLIGDGWTSSERNTGKYALPFGAFSDVGFKPEFRDSSNQVQHAMAGIYLGWAFPSWPTQWFVKRQEDGAADLRLYHATFPIGQELRGRWNYVRLPDLIKERLLA
jgi:hypothetical protein